MVGARPPGERHVAEHTGTNVIVFLFELGKLIGPDEWSGGRGLAGRPPGGTPCFLALRRTFPGRDFLAFGFGCFACAFGSRLTLTLRCGSPLAYRSRLLFESPAFGSLAFHEGFGFEAALFLLASALGSGGHLGLHPLPFFLPLSLGCGLRLFTQAFGLALAGRGSFGFKAASLGFFCPLGREFRLQFAALVFAGLFGGGFRGGFGLLAFFLAGALSRGFCLGFSPLAFLFSCTLRHRLGFRFEALPFFFARSFRSGSRGNFGLFAFFFPGAFSRRFGLELGATSFLFSCTLRRRLGFRLQALAFFFARLFGDRLCRGFRLFPLLVAGAGDGRCGLRFGVGPGPLGFLSQPLRTFPFGSGFRFETQPFIRETLALGLALFVLFFRSEYGKRNVRDERLRLWRRWRCLRLLVSRQCWRRFAAAPFKRRIPCGVACRRSCRALGELVPIDLAATGARVRSGSICLGFQLRHAVAEARDSLLLHLRCARDERPDFLGEKVRIAPRHRLGFFFPAEFAEESPLRGSRVIFYAGPGQLRDCISLQVFGTLERTKVRDEFFFIAR